MTCGTITDADMRVFLWTMSAYQAHFFSKFRIM
jgi:hypothetical protein